jgi:hypothetical protein
MSNLTKIRKKIAGMSESDLKKMAQTEKSEMILGMIKSEIALRKEDAEILMAIGHWNRNKEPYQYCEEAWDI